MGSAELQRPAVLVVDDEVDLLVTYERLLSRQGCHTIKAATCVAALAALERQPIDLVITDLRLLDGDGLDVVRAARGRVDPPPVIVVTGYASEQSRRGVIAAGAMAYLVKPFSTMALTAAVSGTLAAPQGDKGPCGQ